VNEIKVEDEQRDWSVPEYRARRGICKATYAKLKKAGLTPKETTIDLPGFRLTRITAEARRECNQRIAALQESKEAELERARRQAQLERAGRLAAQSPNHVSKNRARSVQRRPRR
jgi:formiminotetrahydrofolate cyclodeaminase